MNSRVNSQTNAALILACCGLLIGGVGCEKKKAPPPPARVVNSAPAEPVWTLEDIAMDGRVQFPEGKTPSTRELAEAIAALASAIATGDDKAMIGMLDPVDHAVMKDLVATGGWKEGTTGVEAVRVCVMEEGAEKTSVRLGLGVQDKLGAYMLAWTGAAAGDKWSFQGMAIMPLMADRVAMLDDSQLVEPSVDVSAPVIAEVVEENTKPSDNITGSDSTSPSDSAPPPEEPSLPQKPPG